MSFNEKALKELVKGKTKVIKGEFGETEIEVPRDREGAAKHYVRFSARVKCPVNLIT